MVPYVNHGRWVMDCTNCGAGILASAEAVTCLECSTGFSIDFPGDRDEGERVLKYRPLMNQNWNPDRETVDDLKAENTLNGLAF